MLAAVASIPRERFVPADQQDRAYENVALPIGSGQTISQPLVVARMLETLELKPSDRVLDVGTGSGYHAALLSLLAGHVWTVERHQGLSALAERAIADLGIDNVTFVAATGGTGCPTRPRSTRSMSRQRPTRYPARSSGSSPTAAGWSRRSGPGSSIWCWSGGAATA